jgi:FkbM family methyltransferase
MDDKGIQAMKTAEIHAVNLDSHFLSDPDLIDLMKVDVEGAEVIVLEGAKELFKQVLKKLLVTYYFSFIHFSFFFSSFFSFFFFFLIYSGV